MNNGRRTTGDGRREAKPASRLRLTAHGFTIIELMTVIIILGLLSGIAILKYLDLRNQARAAEVAGDFRTVMVAAYNYYADHNDWPPDGGAGTPPPPLVQYLPSSFQFSKPEYTLDFDNLGVGGGAYVVGVTVTSASADLMQKLVRTLGTKQPYFQGGASLTYIISAPDGGA
jgi:prepilin-type N-terminal cleavage/methylation domain-containing protein